MVNPIVKQLNDPKSATASEVADYFALLNDEGKKKSQIEDLIKEEEKNRANQRGRNARIILQNLYQKNRGLFCYYMLDSNNDIAFRQSLKEIVCPKTDISELDKNREALFNYLYPNGKINDDEFVEDFKPFFDMMILDQTKNKDKDDHPVSKEDVVSITAYFFSIKRSRFFGGGRAFSNFNDFDVRSHRAGLFARYLIKRSAACPGSPDYSTEEYFINQLLKEPDGLLNKASDREDGYTLSWRYQSRSLDDTNTTDISFEKAQSNDKRFFNAFFNHLLLESIDITDKERAWLKYHLNENIRDSYAYFRIRTNKICENEFNFI